MKLYIANMTRQDVKYFFRMPEKMGALSYQQISSGRQVEINNLSAGDLKAIIEHLERYGVVKRETVRGKLKAFVGVVYSTDKPISENEFHYGNEEVVDSAQNRAVVEATRAALASDMIMDNTRVRGKKKTVVSFQEEAPGKNASKLLNMSIEIDPAVNQSDSLHIN